MNDRYWHFKTAVVCLLMMSTSFLSIHVLSFSSLSPLSSLLSLLLSFFLDLILFTPFQYTSPRFWFNFLSSLTSSRIISQAHHSWYEERYKQTTGQEVMILLLTLVVPWDHDVGHHLRMMYKNNMTFLMICPDGRFFPSLFSLRPSLFKRNKHPKAITYSSL